MGFARTSIPPFRFGESERHRGRSLPELVNAIEGGLASSLGSKFGLPPMATGAIAAALPGLLQKFAHKASDPNDPSITPDSITKHLSGLGDIGGG